MAKVFVSYSRKDIEFAKRLTAELQKSELDFWIDWEGIPPTVDWWKEIEKGIEEADIFLFLISPDSAKSKVCGKEIDHAVLNGKRLIPFVVRDIKADESPQPLASLNWIFSRENDDFQAALQRLLTAIHTDYEWVQAHRRLQVRALEWDRSKRENSFLLRGRDLQVAETQVTAHVAKDPKPTELQTQYVFRSRQSENQRQRNLLLGVGFALIVSIGLGFLAFVNGQNATKNAKDLATQVVIAESEANFRATEQARAEEQTRIALSRSLAAGSRLNLDKQYDLSLLMAVEALSLDDSIEVKSALFDSLEHIPQAIKYYYLGVQSSYSEYYQQMNGLIDFSFDGRYIAARSIGLDIFLIDTEASEPQPKKLTGHEANVIALQFDKSTYELYSVDARGVFIRWDVQSLQPVDKVQIDLNFNLDEGALAPIASISKTGELVAFASYDEILLWNTSTNSLARTIQPDNALGGMPITVLAFSPDGQMIAAGAFYRGFAWSTDTGTPVENGSIDTGRPVTALAFSPDNKFFAAGSTDGFVHIVDMETGEQRDQPPPSYGMDIATGQEITTSVTGHKDEVSGLAFDPTSQMLISTSNDQTFIVWDIGHWPIQRPIDVHHASVVGVAFNPVSGVMASVDVNGVVIVWDNSRNGRLVEYSEDGEPVPLDLTEGQTLSPEECAGFIQQQEGACIVSPDGKWMISYFLRELLGAYANTRIRDSVMGIWDFETRQLVGQQVFSSYEPEAFTFSLEGKFVRILGNSYEYPFIIINLDLASWRSLACATANRNLSQQEWDRYLGGMSYEVTCP